MANAPRDPRLDDEGLKREFAKHWLRRPEEPFACGYLCFPLPEDIFLSAMAASEWMKDPVVLQEKRRLLTEAGPGSMMPTKEEAALIAYRLAETTTHSVSDRLSALRLFADMAGYIQRGPNVSVPIMGTGNSVMVVKDKGDETQWSTGLVSQQQNLVADAQQA